MLSIRDQEIKKFFPAINDRFNHKNLLLKKDLELLFKYAINFLSITFPPKELREYFIKPEIVQLFLNELFNRIQSDKEYELIQKNFYELTEKLGLPSSSGYRIKFRILDRRGYYPNCDLKRENTEYSALNFLPVLITKYKTTSEDFFSNSSEVRWINRRELKVATCCLLATNEGICHFYFADFNYIVLSSETLKDIPQNIQKNFLLELLHYKNRFNFPSKKFLDREPYPDVSEYDFFPFTGSIKTYYRLFDNFSIRDQLLMRTCNFLIKSIMLWQNRNFWEDAISNVMFCMEGCLRLLYRKYSKTDDKFNFKELESIFRELFPNGEQLFLAIKEGYDTRISLIHAEPDWGSEWRPFLFVDDFFDYFNICRKLLNRILIDRKIKF